MSSLSQGENEHSSVNKGSPKKTTTKPAPKPRSKQKCDETGTVRSKHSSTLPESPKKLKCSQSLSNISSLRVQKVNNDASSNPLKFRPLPELPPSDDHEQRVPVSKPAANDCITLADVATKYAALLPRRVEVCRGVFGDDEDDDMCISTGDIYNIHCVKRREMMTLKSATGSKEDEFAVPLNSSIRFSILYDPDGNAGRTAQGHVFSRIKEIIDAKPRPKVVCATKRNTACKVETMVVSGEVLIIIGVEVIEGESYLKTFSLKTDSQKLLPASSIGQFTTKPSDVHMYLHQIVKHSSYLIPSNVLLYPPTDGQVLPEGLRSRPFALIGIASSSSIVATVHLAGNDEQEILDIPSTLDVELKWVELNHKDMLDLRAKTLKVSQEYNETKTIRYRNPNQSEEVYMTQEELYTSVFGTGIGLSPSHNNSTTLWRSSLDADSILGDPKLAPDVKPDPAPRQDTPNGSVTSPVPPQIPLPQQPLSPSHTLQQVKHNSEPTFQHYSTVQKKVRDNTLVTNSSSQLQSNSRLTASALNDQEMYDHPRPSNFEPQGSQRDVSNAVSTHELYDQPRRISLDPSSTPTCSMQPLPAPSYAHSSENDDPNGSDAFRKSSPIPPQLPERSLYNFPQRERYLVPKSPPSARSNKCLPETPYPVKAAVSTQSMHTIASERPSSSLSENFPPSNYNRTAPSSPLHDVCAEDPRREKMLKSTSPTSFNVAVTQASRTENELQMKYETLESEIVLMREKLKVAEQRIEELQRLMTGMVTQNLLSGGISGCRPSNDKNMMTMDEVLEWLEELNLSQYKKKFKAERMCERLLWQCDDEILDKDMGISNRLHRLRILTAIEDRRNLHSKK